MLEPCPNCATVFDSPFCPECGQRSGPMRVTWREFLHETAEGLFNLESRWLTSLWLLVSRPGQLTRAYWEGKRVRYMRPFQLYLLVSFVYFLAYGLYGSVGGAKVVRITASDDDKAVAQAVGQKDDSPAWAVALTDHVTRFQQRSDANQILHTALAEQGPRVLFFLIPLFALLLKLFYVRSGILYTEHVIFALHTHAFAFALLLLSTVFENKLTSAITSLGLPVYGYLALRTAYTQSRWKTLLKLLGLLAIYGLATSLTLAAVTLWTIWHQTS